MRVGDLVMSTLEREPKCVLRITKVYVEEGHRLYNTLTMCGPDCWGFERDNPDPDRSLTFDMDELTLVFRGR